MIAQERVVLVVNSTNEHSHHHKDLLKLPVEKKSTVCWGPVINIYYVEGREGKIMLERSKFL